MEELMSVCQMHTHMSKLPSRPATRSRIRVTLAECQALK